MDGSGNASAPGRAAGDMASAGSRVDRLEHRAVGDDGAGASSGRFRKIRSDAPRSSHADRQDDAVCASVTGDCKSNVVSQSEVMHLTSLRPRQGAPRMTVDPSARRPDRFPSPRPKSASPVACFRPWSTRDRRDMPGQWDPALTCSATSGHTPGTVIRRRHISSVRAIRRRRVSGRAGSLRSAAGPRGMAMQPLRERTGLEADADDVRRPLARSAPRARRRPRPPAPRRPTAPRRRRRSC